MRIGMPIMITANQRKVKHGVELRIAPRAGPEPYRVGKWPLAASHGHGIRPEPMALRSRKRLSRKLDPQNFLPFCARPDP